MRNQIDTEFSENSVVLLEVQRDRAREVEPRAQGAGPRPVGRCGSGVRGKGRSHPGVKYIVLGGIDKFKIDKTGGGIGRLGVGGIT